MSKSVAAAHTAVDAQRVSLVLNELGLGVTIVNDALSRDHVHLFVEIPPNVSISQFVQHAKGRSSRKIQQEFEHIRKRYWGQRF